MFVKPFRWIFGAAIVRRLPRETFCFEGKELQYFYHTYNTTWANERMIEVPIALTYLSRVEPANVLEIGNVLSHYFPITHTVLDKYERGAGIVNCDILDYNPGRSYDLIISISTFEHIGFDDESATESRAKIIGAVAQCRKFLRAGGKLMLTVPIGYNPQMDALLADCGLQPARELYFGRREFRRWNTAEKGEALRCQFKRPFPYANAIAVLELRAE